MNGARRHWLICLAAVIAAGILSRTIHSGWILMDKYLGDALYASMIYILLRLLRLKASPSRVALISGLLMLAIECFQLTMIPAHFAVNANPVVRIAGRLLGTEFSFLDLAAYIPGILVPYLFDRR